MDQRAAWREIVVKLATFIPESDRMVLSVPDAITAIAEAVALERERWASHVKACDAALSCLLEILKHMNYLGEGK